MSNAALRASKTSNEMQPWSDARSKSFVSLTSAVSVLWRGLKQILHRYNYFAIRSTNEQTQLFLTFLTLTEDLKWACNLPVHKDLVLVS